MFCASFIRAQCVSKKWPLNLRKLRRIFQYDEIFLNTQGKEELSGVTFWCIVTYLIVVRDVIISLWHLPTVQIGRKNVTAKKSVCGSNLGNLSLNMVLTIIIHFWQHHLLAFVKQVLIFRCPGKALFGHFENLSFSFLSSAPKIFCL